MFVKMCSRPIPSDQMALGSSIPLCNFGCIKNAGELPRLWVRPDAHNTSTAACQKPSLGPTRSA